MRNYIIILLFLLNCKLNAQENRYINLTTTNGLANDNVYVAQQSDDGKMWFGTNFGLSSYDGFRFENYGRANGIASKAVIDIVNAGGDSLLFIAYPNTLQTFTKKKQIRTIEVYKNFTIEFLVKHKNNFIFYNKSSSMFGVWDGKTSNFYDLALLANLTNLNIQSVNANHEQLIIVTNLGVYSFENSKATLISNSNTATHYFKINNQQVLLSNANISKMADVNTNQVIANYTNIGKNAFFAMQTKGNDIWFRGLDKGLFKYSNGQITELSKKFKLDQIVIHKIFEDKDYNVWLCTDGSGIVLIPNSNFIIYNTNDGLTNNKITQLVQSKTGLIIGTNNGLNFFVDNKIGKFDLLPLQPKLQYTHHLSSSKEYDFNINITNTFAEFSNINQNKIVHKQQNGFNFLATSGTTIYQQSTQKYWSANHNEIVFFDNFKIQKVINIAEQKVRKVYELIMYNNQFWVATTDGLLNLNGNIIIKNQQFCNKKFGEVLDLYVDSKNVLWITTDNGLFTFNSKTWEVPFEIDDVLQKYCLKITEDNDGVKWIATWGGLVKWNGKTKVVYNVKNGLSSNTVNTVLYEARSDNLYIGTENGLNVIKKAQLISDTIARQLTIVANSANGKVFENNVELPANTNSVSFYLNVPFFSFDNSVIYEYKINNGAWQKTNNPNVILPNLNNGNYILYARAIINGMVVNKSDMQFAFKVKTPFYKTWLFIILSAALLQYGFYRIYSNYKKKKWVKQKMQHQLEMQMADLKQQAFTSLLNPHFIFNSLNSIQNYINKQDRQNANRYLSDFAKLIRKNFNSSKFSLIDLDEELETIAIYLQLEKMRFTDKFDYEIKVDNSIAQGDYVLPSLMIQPFVENAMLHGLNYLSTKGKLTIDVTIINQQLSILIKDNGIGIEKSKQLKTNTNHKSRGMQLIADRIEMFNKLNTEPIVLKIYPLLPNEENQGNVIDLLIPQSIKQSLKQNED
jgi:ligand-binding sensor domain-containing protein/two-component sensor histidine kinase